MKSKLSKVTVFLVEQEGRTPTTFVTSVIETQTDDRQAKISIEPDIVRVKQRASVKVTIVEDTSQNKGSS